MRSRTPVVIAVAIAAAAPTAAPSSARADVDKPDRATVMVVDVMGDGLVVAGLAGKNRVLGVLGGVAYLAGAPLVHGTKDHWDRAAQSLGVRVGAPVVGALVGCTLIGEHGDHKLSIFPRKPCGLGLAVGVLAGAVAAQIVDWTLISKGDRGVNQAPVAFSIGGSF